MKSDNRVSVYIYAIVIPICVIAYFVINNSKSKSRNEVLSNRSEVIIGDYHSVWMAGTPGTTYLKVRYRVKGENYLQSVKSRTIYDKCLNNDCEDLQFYVIYDTVNPANSLVNPIDKVDSSFNYSVENFR